MSSRISAITSLENSASPASAPATQPEQAAGWGEDLRRRSAFGVKSISILAAKT
jgi:hypothetical protein